MIIAMYCVAAAMILGGTYSAISGWEIVIIERGWTQVLSGVIVATGGVLLAGMAFLAGELRRMTTSLARQPAAAPLSATPPRPAAESDAPGGAAGQTDTRTADPRIADPAALPLAAGAASAVGAVAAHGQMPPDDAEAKPSGDDADRGDDLEKIAAAEEALPEPASATSHGEETEEPRALAGQADEDPVAPDIAAQDAEAVTSHVAGQAEDDRLSDRAIFADLLAGQTEGADETAPHDGSEDQDPGDALSQSPLTEAPETQAPEEQAPEPEAILEAPEQEPPPEEEVPPEEWRAEEPPEEAHPDDEALRAEPLEVERLKAEPLEVVASPEDVAEEISAQSAPDAPPPPDAPAEEEPASPQTPRDADIPTASEPDQPEAVADEVQAGPSPDEEVGEAVTEEPVVAAEDLAVPPPSVIGTYESGGNTYTMYSDGSIDAQTPEGDYHFASLDDLKRFIAEGGESGRA